MTDTLPAWADPDHQPALPFAAANDYALTVMGWARQALPADIVVHEALPFGAHRLQRLDVYAPAAATNAPVLVFWHGGGWTNGYRGYVRFMARHVTRLGMVLVAPGYRLAPEHRMPQLVDDALAALVHVHRHAADWGGSAQRLLLAGHSAGGHLAALTTLRSAQRQAAGVPDAHIAGCLPISGIMDLHHPQPAAGSLEERVYSTVLPEQEPHLDALYSPLCWAAGNRVPCVLSWGSADSERVRLSNQRLAALLQEQAAPLATHALAGTDHFGTHTGLNEAGHPWYASLARLAGR
jgi:acetyl esterase/lipase